jgi:ankyrin repeat protein
MKSLWLKKGCMLVCCFLLFSGFRLAANPADDGTGEEYDEYDDSGDYDYDYDYEADSGDDDAVAADPVFDLVRSGTLDDIKAGYTEKIDSDGNSPLSVACMSNREKEIIAWILGSGSPVNARNYSGATPLMEYCSVGTDPAVIDLLVKKGAKIAAFNESGMTPLMYATGNANPEIFRRVLKNGGSTRDLDESNRSVLSWACSQSAFPADLLASLVKAGCDVNAADLEGATPLMYAACLSTPEVCDALIKAGAKVDAVNEYGETPLLWAAGSNGDLGVLRLLVSAGASVSARPKNGQTVLSCAAGQGNAALVSMFLKMGIPVNSVDDDGKTALILACESAEDPSVVEMLLDAGADIGIVDDAGKNAYAYALDNDALAGDPVCDRLKGPLTAL